MYGNTMRLTQDSVVKTVKVKNEDRSVYNNRVAIKDGDQTVFVGITAWGGLADLMGQYLEKGDEFYGEGELRNGTVLGKEDKELQTVYLLLEKIKFLHGKKKEKPSDQEESNT
ncbi:MAG: single-stranded DNA-binding protein [Eubacteriales bacterium]|nr:single-stranded DNA-binding protein [Eubacteriales bacterium]MDD3350005.1 single-stranded DNA-binding protein [Eubacteriales bacterium]